MQLNPVAETILKERYLQRSGDIQETPLELFQRVAKTIAEAEYRFCHSEEKVIHYYNIFLAMLTKLDFLPNSPTLLNAGKQQGQMAACFVLPIENSIEDIFTSLKDMAVIHNHSGGTGFSLSKLSSENKYSSSSSNNNSLSPIAVMNLFNLASTMVRQGGIRPGANMAALAVDHPDILKFIESKNQENTFTNFNISVAISDSFMEKVALDGWVELKYDGIVEEKVRARKILAAIGENAWKNGEPGVLFIDRINKYNPTPTQGNIETTNPCGEQPLLPYESCTLGSINLVNFYSNERKQIDWDGLKTCVTNAIRFLDNVLEVNYYPIEKIANKTMGNRKVGLGVMGFANMLQLMELPYGSQPALLLAEKLMKFIQEQAKNASCMLAHERGSFKNIGESIYRGKTMRNATCTTIAPTGTISSIAGVSSGIEPSFNLVYQRQLLGKRIIEINRYFLEKMAEKYGYSKAEEIRHYLLQHGDIEELDLLSPQDKLIFAAAEKIPPIKHLQIQAAFQKYCDNAVSKTINLPYESTPQEICEIIKQAYYLGCKGLTLYRRGSRQEEVLSTGLAANRN